MTATLHCPDCGSPLPADAPQGECPRCLLRAGFESEPALSAAVATPSVVATRTSAGHGHFVPPSVAELQQRIPQYEILELVGQGGMGAVYKAKQAGLGRLVAIKILPVEVSQSPAFTERFAREARALALLSHPHIVAVHDFGQADGLCDFVMEYVDGVNLRQALQAGKMNPQQALAIVPQICEALQFAHEEGVVHRDIKPENILIDKRGRVKIADFGLAKLLGAEALEHSLTGTQQVMGTLRYMAPEQMFGSKEVDHRADIFSLGVVFYELLTGELPIGRFALPSKKSGVDVRLDEVVLRALESEPSDRYQSVSEMKHGLDSISRLELPATTPKPVASRAVSTGELELLLDQTDTTIRHRQHLLILGGFALVVLGGVCLAFGFVGSALVYLAPAGALFAVAYMYSQHWDVNVGGHRVVLENGVFTGSRLYINGEFVARSGIGYRQEIQGWLPDGSGRRIVAMTEAAFTHFHCRLFLQPAVPGVPAPPTGSTRPNTTFAGSVGHLALALVATLVLLTFLLYVGGPFLLMIDGPDRHLLELGHIWGIGSAVNAIVSVLFLMFGVLGGVTTFAWWTYRAALRDRYPQTPAALPAEGTPRLSRAAAWGAALSPLFVLGVCLAVVATIPTHRVEGNESPSAGISIRLGILFGLIELICLVAPFATTLLGIIAIGNIRRSSGKVYGMPLAVFDALLYPLLLLDLILFVVGFLGFSLVASLLLQLMKTEGIVMVAWLPVLLATVLLVGPLIVLLDLWLIRLTWRGATNGLATEAEEQKQRGLPLKEPPPFQPALGRKTTSAMVVVLIVLALLTLPMLLACGVIGGYFLMPIHPSQGPMLPAEMSHEHVDHDHGDNATGPVVEQLEPTKAAH